MGLWDYGIIGLWDYRIIGLWDYRIMGLWDYDPIAIGIIENKRLQVEPFLLFNYFKLLQIVINVLYIIIAF